GFTEFRYRKQEMDGFLRRTSFEIERVVPDDYFLPWSKGLFVDLCDVGSFVHYEHKPPYEFGRFGQAVVRAIQSVGIWHSCEGIMQRARAGMWPPAPAPPPGETSAPRRATAEAGPGDRAAPGSATTATAPSWCRAGSAAGRSRSRSPPSRAPRPWRGR